MAYYFRCVCFVVLAKKTSYSWTLRRIATDNPGNNPVPVFSYLVEELAKRHPKLGYLHVIEPRVKGVFDRDDHVANKESNDFLRDIWAGKAWIAAGGFSRESAIKQADEKGELVAFGRHYTSNVSLITTNVFRLVVDKYRQ